MPDKENSPSTPQPSEAEQSATSKNHFDVDFYSDWCKACGICIAFCPKKIIRAGKNGKPMVDDPDACIGCRFCEVHCPDFAITVSVRRPKRRKDDA